MFGLGDIQGNPHMANLGDPRGAMDSHPARGRRNETVEDRQLAMVQVWNPEDPATVIWLDSLFADDDGLLGAVAWELRQAAWTGKGSLPGRAEYYERYRLITRPTASASSCLLGLSLISLARSLTTA